MGARSISGSRGQPLKALGGVLLGWVIVRAAFFELPDMPVAALQTGGELVGLVRLSDPSPSPTATGRPFARLDLRDLPPLSPDRLPARAMMPPLNRPVALSAGPRIAAGHDLPLMTATIGLPFLPEAGAALAPLRPAAPSTAGRSRQVARADRWSADAWLVWRPGSAGAIAAGAGAPVYGGSQAGAVLRYNLSPASRAQPAAYVRAVHAFSARPESDLAAGLAVQPLARVPITAHGEVRLARRGSDLEPKPAAFLSGGFDDTPVGAGIAVRSYLQAGYVGGRDTTPFADGSLVAERAIYDRGQSTWTAAVGAWGGAQRGATRLDLGPTAGVRFRLGDTHARLSADYRLRVAGNAEPAAGAALTLSAGF